MGRANASAVMVEWRHIEHAPMRLLVHMALMSLDPPGNGEMDPCLYFMGWEMQALALGFNPPSATATDTFSVARRGSIHRTVRRHRSILVAEQALTLLKTSAPGRPPLWLVHTEKLST